MKDLTVIFFEKMKSFCAENFIEKWKKSRQREQMQSRHFAKEQRNSLDEQRNWWLSSCFPDREERYQNLPLETSPTQSDYQNTAGNPEERDPQTPEIT